MGYIVYLMLLFTIDLEKDEKQSADNIFKVFLYNNIMSICLQSICFEINPIFYVFGRYLGNTSNFAESGDPLTRFLDKLFEEAIQDSTEEVVRDTVRELASDHMRVNSTAAVVDDLLLDHLQDIEGEMAS